MIIVLMGYMGSGKSTIGKKLATQLNSSFVDLDDYISEKENKSIPDIFSSKGEIYFRKKESAYLSEILNSSENSVLALGGGTPCYSTNLNLILETPNVISVYLKLSIKTLTQRLFEQKVGRPLIDHLNSEEELMEFVGKHLFERSPYYSKANYKIETDGLSEKETLSALLKLI